MTTLDSIAQAIVDCEHKTAPEGDGFALSVGTKAMKDGRLVVEACKPVSEQTFEMWTRRMLPVEGDLILAREAPVGQVVRIPAEHRVCLGQRTVLVRPDPGAVVPRFLHYWLLGPNAQERMSALAAGATVPHLNVADIRDLDISSMPQDERTQRFAADTLGAIDDLIENNRRRVALLEGMARAIYREWFGRFSYPGVEEVPLVDSLLGPVPQGWEVRRLDDVARLVRGRSYRKAELVERGGLPFVNLKCMRRGGGFRADGLKRYAGRYTEEQLVGHGDLVLAVTDLTQGREILARATLVPRLTEERGVISLDVARIVPHDRGDRLWIFAALRWSDFADRVKEFANGSTVLHLSPQHVEAGSVLWPPESVRHAFVGRVAPMLTLVDELNDAASALVELRDLLLPKLVSGAIDVSVLDLELAGATA